MNTPQVHEFGVAKYVYASAYDKLEAENAKLRELAKGAIAGLYTSEWPCIGPENVTRISKILQQIAYGEGGGAS